jgi:hypothetical protein
MATPKPVCAYDALAKRLYGLMCRDLADLVFASLRLPLYTYTPCDAEVLTHNGMNCSRSFVWTLSVVPQSPCSRNPCPFHAPVALTVPEFGLLFDRPFVTSYTFGFEDSTRRDTTITAARATYPSCKVECPHFVQVRGPGRSLKVVGILGSHELQRYLARMVRVFKANQTCC